MCLLEVVGGQGKVVFLFAQVVRLRAAFHVCQLQPESGFAISEKDDCKVRLVISGNLLEPEGVMVKLQALFQVFHVKVEMIKSKHSVLLS